MILKIRKCWQDVALCLAALSLVLTACGPKQAELTPTAAQTELPTAAAASAEPADASQPRVLNVCTAEEPVSLYRYDGRNSISKQTIFSALYGGTFMAREELWESLLDQMPSLENGAIEIVSKTVEAGDVVVDLAGHLVVLKPGVQVVPFGCGEGDCSITWDGESELSLPQVVISYQLKPDLVWSDGEPLTASDLLFAFQVDGDDATPTTKRRVDFTDTAAVSGDLIFIWKGVPGISTPHPEHYLWAPLPEHLLGNLGAKEVLESDLANQSPLGWGPYRMTSWDRGEQISFERGPRDPLNEPVINQFDYLNIKFVPQKNDALRAFEQGECDILDASFGLNDGDANGVVRLIPLNEYGALVFGIKPSSYDDGHSLWDEERPDYFNDLRVRQAIALCIDPRALMADVAIEHYHADPDSVNLPDNSLPAVQPDALLSEAGWVDEDGLPQTPRVSQGSSFVNDGMPFEIKLYSGLAEADVYAAQKVAERLGACGIKVGVSSLPAVELYAPGPNGVLFGRQFDLALVNWSGYPGVAKGCEYYLSSQVPNAANSWVGTNLAGWADAAFDAACLHGEMPNQLLALDLTRRYEVEIWRQGLLSVE